MAIELKPCPFCGGEPLALYNMGWMIHCPSCQFDYGSEGDDTGGHSSERIAADAWNKRS